MKNLAIIPARCGSKGLVNKNIKDLCGKPMLAYAIDAARNSGCFEEVMVSTDSEEYATIARKYGAKVPFLRSEKNANDVASTWDMVLEVIQKYRQYGKEFDTFCLLQPTSPLRDEDDIRGAYQVYQDNAGESVVSVCECEHSPLWTGTLNDKLEMYGFLSGNRSKQRQQQEKYFRVNGAIYIMNINVFCKEQNLYGPKSYAYVMDKRKSIDIDDIYDFEYAEFLMGKRKDKYEHAISN